MLFARQDSSFLVLEKSDYILYYMHLHILLHALHDKYMISDFITSNVTCILQFMLHVW